MSQEENESQVLHSNLMALAESFVGAPWEADFETRNKALLDSAAALLHNVPFKTLMRTFFEIVASRIAFEAKQGSYSVPEERPRDMQLRDAIGAVFMGEFERREIEVDISSFVMEGEEQAKPDLKDLN